MNLQVLPFDPMTMTFKDIHYFVPLPTVLLSWLIKPKRMVNFFIEYAHMLCRDIKVVLLLASVQKVLMSASWSCAALP